MRLTFIYVSMVMTLKEVLRNRISILLFFLIPTLFFIIIILTTTDRILAFKLSAVSESTYVEVSEQNESLIFIGMAAVCLITSFISLNLLQKNWEANRRLSLCGYKPSELIFAKLSVMIILVILVAVYVGLLLQLFFRPENMFGVIAGFIAGGFVYGSYGLLAGSVFNRDLEGILVIVLLVNIDAGWLQNPIYYADAQNTAIIRSLPAYFPSQMSLISAFSGFSVIKAFAGSLLYALVFLCAAMMIFNSRMKI
jgi:hypothetical protein